MHSNFFHFKIRIIDQIQNISLIYKQCLIYIFYPGGFLLLLWRSNYDVFEKILDIMILIFWNFQIFWKMHIDALIKDFSPPPVFIITCQEIYIFSKSPLLFVKIINFSLFDYIRIKKITNWKKRNYTGWPKI